MYLRATILVLAACAMAVGQAPVGPPVSGFVFNEPTPARGNYVRLRVSPSVQIAIGAYTKRPGEGMKGDAVDGRIGGHGRDDDAVLEGHAADGDGCEEQRLGHGQMRPRWRAAFAAECRAQQLARRAVKHRDFPHWT